MRQKMPVSWQHRSLAHLMKPLDRKLFRTRKSWFMKWKKRFITCSLLVGLMASINSKTSAQPSLELITEKTLSFPSASGIECYNDKLYVFGDNATHLLILSTDYNKADSVRYWKRNENMIEKKEKPDIESAMVAERDNQAILYGIG